jgi:osmotically-inducible protein OsmY
MTTALRTDTDVALRDAVVRQLEWDPGVDATSIGVSALGGAVTLTGFIDTYAGKLAAERAAKRVRGVRGVANDIDVRLKFERADADIAADAARALQLRHDVPETVQAVVHDGHVTLTGRVQWLFQRSEAKAAVRRLPGVINVIDRIEVVPSALPRDVRHRITEALHRIADVNARHIAITVTGSTVTLTGSVTTWAQREAAERAASHAPGIEHVENLIDVVPGDPL